ncbi:hypothetical protein HOLDEFILI_00019 [Holdemania filiformis DSM 12042]|uniref:Uncharacterized protein n=1 Tax=Holdemania filiformis DSM 12042 TaxID=545696 RepID=B9Y2J5_9FIRM|nr:hypothetical protein HOLDEFILI_00019 [Holdemania filiformis DSM 12042]
MHAIAVNRAAFDPCQQIAISAKIIRKAVAAKYFKLIFLDDGDRQISAHQQSVDLIHKQPSFLFILFSAIPKSLAMPACFSINSAMTQHFLNVKALLQKRDPCLINYF